MNRSSKSLRFRRGGANTPWVAMGALVASTTLGVRLDAVHDRRVTALRFVVPSETLGGAWRDDTPRVASVLGPWERQRARMADATRALRSP